jgi:hypothetical protein
MSSLVDLATAVGVLLGSMACVQEPSETKSAPAQKKAALLAKLKAKAAKEESAELSKLFSVLRDPKKTAALGLSKNQVELAGRLEQLTRDIIKAWLLRELDSGPPPSTDAQLERLSEHRDRVRARVVIQAEAIVLEGILTTEQLRVCREATGLKPGRPAPGRFGSPQVPAPDENSTAEELAAAVQYYATGYRHAGEIFSALLGNPLLRDMFPDGIEHLTGSSLALARSYEPKVELPRITSDLVARLDKLVIDAYRSRLTHDLEKVPPPSRQMLVERILGHIRLSDSLFAHAEAIALEGILTSEQAELCLMVVWEGNGTRALLDPALASRLRLTRSQREQVVLLLENETLISDQQTEAQASIMGLIPSRPELKALDEQIVADAKGRMNQADGMIWDLLTPAQLRTLTRILNRPNPAARARPESVKKSRRAG